MASTASCTYCLTPLGAAEPRAECPSCHGQHHVECWDENDGCATFGCVQAGGANRARPGPAAAPLLVGGGTAVATLAPAQFCDQCGVRVSTTDLSCAACGSALYGDLG